MRTKEKYKKETSNRCLISKKVNKLKSRYGRLFMRGYIDEGKHIYNESYHNALSKKKDLITFLEQKIIQITSKKTVSVVRNYKYWPEGIEQELVGSFECENYKHMNLSEILVPNK